CCLPPALNQCAFVLARDDIEQGFRLVHVEYPHRQVVVPAQTDGREVHHFQLATQHLVEGQAVVLHRRRVLHRVRRIHAVHLGGLQHQIDVDLDAAQAGGGVGGEERIAGAGREDDDVALTQVADRGAAVIVLYHAAHRNGRHDACTNVGALQGIAQGQSVHYRGQHAHVVAGDPLHAGLVQGGTPEQVAAANHQADLHADLDQLADLQRQAVEHLRVDAEIGTAGQGFPAQFE